MTRSNPTDAELRMKEVILDHLHTSDPDAAVLDRDPEDKPDLAFRYQGATVACECVQIPPASVFQWLHRQISSEPDGPYCHAVVWAEEPHSWVHEAVSSKAPKVKDYRRAVAADSVWLLVHTPIEDRQFFVRGDFSWEAQMLRHGASCADHEFDRVLFWEPRSGLQEIHAPGQSSPPVRFDFTDGYPSRSFVGFGGFPFTTPSEGEPPKTYEYAPIDPRIIIVPPVDPEYAKHEPRFRNRSYKVTIVAHPDRADSSVEIIWADQEGTGHP